MASVGHGNMQVRGLLRVASSITFGRAYLMPAMQEFLDQYPGLQLDLRLSDGMHDLAADGIDVAVRIGPMRDSALVAVPLARSRMVLCAAPSYLKQRGTPQHPDQLQQHECVVLQAIDPWRLRAPDGSELNFRVQGRFRSDNGLAVRDATVDGMGISLLATWLIDKQLQSGELVRILPEFQSDHSMISAVYLNRKFLPPKSRAFIDFFAQRFAADPVWAAP